MQEATILALISLSLAGIGFSKGHSTSHLERACRHHTLGLSCPSEYVITVTSASYGRNIGMEVCPKSILPVTSGCHASNSLAIVQNECEGENSCSVLASNSVFGDPCVYTYKYLEVEYDCVPQFTTDRVFTDRVCEHETLHLSCPENERLAISRASYGRNAGYEICGQPHLPVTSGCHAHTSLAVVKSECEDENSCSVRASNSVFGDPCVGTFKYLEVQYECQATSNTDTVCEHETLSLACPKCEVISIISAFYGRNAGPDVCPGANDNVTRRCRATSSYDIVREACQGKKTCAVRASNGVFGDPCYGTFKYLQVSYECIGTG